MKKIKKAQLAYDAMRAKEMNEVNGGGSGFCLYCGRSVPGGGDDCGVCRPRCFMCGNVITPGMPHLCSGGLDPRL